MFNNLTCKGLAGILHIIRLLNTCNFNTKNLLKFPNCSLAHNSATMKQPTGNVYRPFLVVHLPAPSENTNTHDS